MKKIFSAALAILMSMCFTACAQDLDQIQTNAQQAKELYSEAGTTAMGSKDAPVTLVEIFDYGCRYCRKDLPMLIDFAKQHPNVRIIFKSFNAFGPESMTLPQYAALAANQQGKFLEMHHALMSTQPLDAAAIDKIAKNLKLNIIKLHAAMASAAVHKQIENNTELMRSLSIEGVPTVVATQTKLAQDPSRATRIPQYIQMGFLSDDNLAQLVKQVEKDSKQ